MGNTLPIPDSLINQGWLCISKQSQYIISLDSNLVALRNSLEHLKRRYNDVKRKIEVVEGKQVEGQQMKRLDEVEWWLSKVEEVEKETTELISAGSEAIKRKCCGCFPQPSKSAYKLGREVVKNQELVNDLIGEGHFEVVAEKLPSLVAVERPMEITVGIDQKVDEVWSCLQMDNVGIIGLHGLGGVGKTVLLKKINNKFINNGHGFDIVIWVVVSKDLDMDQVQVSIAEKVGIDMEAWKNKIEDEKVQQIFKKLSQKRFVILLDDLWVRVELSRIGIPLPNIHNKSKVILTSRSKDVCGRMEADVQIEVDCLSQSEAWDLFQLKLRTNILVKDAKILELAKRIVERCWGLPLALITIARAMASKKSPEEWSYVRGLLDNSPAEFPDMENDVFMILKCSFDSLPDDTVKECFLYCSLFPEQHTINKRDLIYFWFGEELVNKSGDFDSIIKHGYFIISILRDAGLLEEISGKQVKMHGLIREMALWITSEKERTNKCLVKARAQLTKAPKVTEWKGVKRISLMGNNIEELAEIPESSNLLTLILRDAGLKRITSGFFQSMHSLHVLDLSHNKRLVELPPEIGDLMSLMHLNISWTSVSELPLQLRNLKNLKYWNLEVFVGIKNASEVISSLSSLQVLQMSSTIVRENHAVIDDLECLEELNYVSLCVGTSSACERISSSQKVRSAVRVLYLVIMKDLTTLNVSSMEKIEKLGLFDCKELEDLMSDLPQKNEITVAFDNPRYCELLNQSYFHSLRSVKIHNCPKLKNVTWLLLAPNLEKLAIKYCQMKEVISCGELVEAAENGAIPNPFAKLKSLKLHDLPELKSIYPGVFPDTCFTSLMIVSCPELKKLPFNCSHVKECTLTIEGHDDWFNEWEYEDDVARATNFSMK